MKNKVSTVMVLLIAIFIQQNPLTARARGPEDSNNNSNIPEIRLVGENLLVTPPPDLPIVNFIIRTHLIDTLEKVNKKVTYYHETIKSNWKLLLEQQRQLIQQINTIDTLRYLANSLKLSRTNEY